MSGDRAQAQPRQGRPPEAAYFTGLWKPLGLRSAAMELPGLSIQIDGMDDAWCESFVAHHAPYARDTSADRGAFSLTLSAARDRKRGGAREHYIEPPPPGRADLNPVFVELEPDPGSPGEWIVRACTYSMAASFPTGGGRGLAVFAGGDLQAVDPRERAVENILRVATAWLAISRGGVLMHSASIVKDGSAYLFFGQSGAGKSTLAACSRRGLVVSDDLTLLLPGAGGRPEAVGSPFRGTYQGSPPVQGCFPVAAAFRLLKAGAGEAAAVQPFRPAFAMAAAIANLPFVVDQLHVAPGLFASVERLFGAFPIHALRFRREDDSFWEAIETAGL